MGTRIEGIWYFRKVEISFDQLSPVSTCLCPKYQKLSFQNLGICREGKKRRR